MTRLDAFERIVAALNEAMLDDARWPEASALMDEACGATGNILIFAEDAPANRPEILFVKCHQRGEDRSDWAREYFRTYHLVDEHVPRLLRLSALERPIGTSSSHNMVWHGYAPFNPQMLGKYLTIFRAVSNFVQTGDDGRTPAMRLGIERAPLTFEDLLWPGQRIPRPRRSRRKGRVAPVQLVAQARRKKLSFGQPQNRA